MGSGDGCWVCGLVWMVFTGCWGVVRVGFVVCVVFRSGELLLKCCVFGVGVWGGWFGDGVREVLVVVVFLLSLFLYIIFIYFVD